MENAAARYRTQVLVFMYYDTVPKMANSKWIFQTKLDQWYYAQINYGTMLNVQCLICLAKKKVSTFVMTTIS